LIIEGGRPGHSCGEITVLSAAPTPTILNNPDLWEGNPKASFNSRWQNTLEILKQWSNDDKLFARTRTFVASINNIYTEEGEYRGAVIQVNFNYNTKEVPGDLLAQLADEKVVVTMSSPKWSNGHAEAADASEITDEAFQREAFGGDIGGVQAAIVNRPICPECGDAGYLRWYTGSSIGTSTGEYGYEDTGMGGTIELTDETITEYRVTGGTAFDAVVDFVGEFPIEPSEGWAPPPQQ
jgi:hypothetical protein